MITKTKAAYWLSEAWGQKVKAKDVIVRNNWMFVRGDTDVDCIHTPHGDLSGEAWDGIKLDKSPFVIKDKIEVRKITNALDKGYKLYLMEHCGYTEEDWIKEKGDE